MKAFPFVSTPTYLSKLPVRVSTQAVRDITHLHFHRHIQLCFVLSGELQQTVNGIEYTCRSGSCAFLLPYMPHSFNAINSDDTPIITHIWFDLDFLASRGIDFFAYGEATSHFEKKAIPNVVDFAENKEASIKIVREIIAEFDKRTEMSYDKLASLIAELFRLACKKEKNVKITAPFRRQTESINRVAEYIEKNYREKLSVDELCAIAETSRRSFTANFRTVTGISPNDYILSARLDHASFLLVATDRLYDDIAKDSGLYNHSNLARVFLKHLGETPTEHRARRMRELRSQKLAKPLSRYDWLKEI